MLAPNDQTELCQSRFPVGDAVAEFDTLSKIDLEEDRRTDCQRIRSYDRCDRRQGPAEERPIPDILQTISLFIAGENFASANALLEPLTKKDPANWNSHFYSRKLNSASLILSLASLLFQKLDLQIENNPGMAGWGKCLLEKKNSTMPSQF